VDKIFPEREYDYCLQLLRDASCCRGTVNSFDEMFSHSKLFVAVWKIKRPVCGIGVQRI
jgi:hypothetical protein